MISVLVVSANNYYRACRARDLVKKVFDDVSVWSITRDGLCNVDRKYDLIIMDAHMTSASDYTSAIVWSDGTKLDSGLHHRIMCEISPIYGRVVLWEFGKEACTESVHDLVKRVKTTFSGSIPDDFEHIKAFRETLQTRDFNAAIFVVSDKYPDFIDVPYCKEIRPLIEAEINKKLKTNSFYGISPELARYYSSDIDVCSLYPKLMLSNNLTGFSITHSVIDEWYGAVGKVQLKKLKGEKDTVTVEIKKVISSGNKTIVIFSDGKKVIITDEKPGVDTLDLYNRIMFAVIKKHVTPKQFEFFCDYCSIDGASSDNCYANNEAQKKMLRAFVKAVIPDKNFWPRWSRYINHLIYELSDKEQKKIFITQVPKKKK